MSVFSIACWRSQRQPSFVLALIEIEWHSWRTLTARIGVLFCVFRSASSQDVLLVISSVCGKLDLHPHAPITDVTSTPDVHVDGACRSTSTRGPLQVAAWCTVDVRDLVSTLSHRRADRLCPVPFVTLRGRSLRFERIRQCFNGCTTRGTVDLRTC